MRSTTYCLVVLALLLFVPAAGADLCNDINDVANGWNDVANALDNSSGEELEDLDVKSIRRDVNVLLEPTEILGKALIEIGNADEEELGNDLCDLVDELYDVGEDDFIDYVVDVIDDIVDTLDEVVDYCDYVNE